MWRRQWRAAPLLAGLVLAACGDGGSGGGGVAGQPVSKIEHLVVIIQENISFDAYFGTYCQAPTGSNPTCTEGPACCEAAPATDPGSGQSPLLLDDEQHGVYDPNHESECMVTEINGGLMDGYVTAPCGNPQNFAYADEASVGGYRDLARQYALADRYFQPVVGASSGNDMYFARAHFVFPDNMFVPDSIGAHCTLNFLSPVTYTDQTVGDLMADAGVSWAFYIQGYDDKLEAVAQGGCGEAPPECATGLPFYPCTYDPSDIPFQYYPRFRDNPTYMRDYDHQFADDLAQGQLPSVTYVKAIGFRSEHPGYGDTISAGFAFTSTLIDQVLASPIADQTLILLTYDESGGYFDHVAPPPDSTVDGQAYGARAPALAIGHFARHNAVSHVTMEHSSVVKFIEWNWLAKKTGQLGTRDAVVNNIGSLLDPAQTGVRVPD